MKFKDWREKDWTGEKNLFRSVDGKVSFTFRSVDGKVSFTHPTEAMIGYKGETYSVEYVGVNRKNLRTADWDRSVHIEPVSSRTERYYVVDHKTRKAIKKLVMKYWPFKL